MIQTRKWDLVRDNKKFAEVVKGYILCISWLESF